MQTDILASPEAAAAAAASFIANAARQAIKERDCFAFAVSGGHSPWIMLRELGEEKLEWSKIHVFQVDERIAPKGDDDRNLTHLKESLLATAPIDPQNIYAMPVDHEDVNKAAAEYGQTLASVCGSPVKLDLVHLGLGPDGHTASLVPNDTVLEVTDRDVALTGGTYQGRQRMTLTYPCINRARQIMWLVTGAAKQPVFPKLQAGDPSIPGGRVEQEHAVLIADRDATGT
ncbi:MAG: 6-phosphogluconolactonase [Phycisphaerales bacterium]|nr:6-phosphogluconolactonase [Phycisphaerales bacterium]